MLNETTNQTFNNATSQSSASGSQANQPQNFIIEFLLYHAITIGAILIFAAAMLVNHLGTKKNMQIATKTQTIIHNFLKFNFTNYSG